MSRPSLHNLRVQYSNQQPSTSIHDQLTFHCVRIPTLPPVVFDHINLHDKTNLPRHQETEHHTNNTFKHNSFNATPTTTTFQRHQANHETPQLHQLHQQRYIRTKPIRPPYSRTTTRPNQQLQLHNSSTHHLPAFLPSTNQRPPVKSILQPLPMPRHSKYLIIPTHLLRTCAFTRLR